MPKLNENYLNLKASYLFSEIAHRTAAYKEANPEKGAQIIRLGIGDVTLPLGKVVIDALHEGVEAMASAETFKGYGPEQGYEETRNAIAAYLSLIHIYLVSCSLLFAFCSLFTVISIASLFILRNMKEFKNLSRSPAVHTFHFRQFLLRGRLDIFQRLEGFHQCLSPCRSYARNIIQHLSLIHI